MDWKLGGLILCVALSGCAPFETHEPIAAFDSSVYGLGPGDARIEGQGFLRTMGGEVRYAAGSKVYLMRATPFVDECVSISSGYGSTTCGDKLRSVVPSVQADGEGRFFFDHVPAGRYFVQTSVTWYSGNNYFPEGGNVGVYVDAPAGGIARAIVTR